jgi:catechol 2,3-dioxygenase-like lactoylglutathione lyase family enzyme
MTGTAVAVLGIDNVLFTVGDLDRAVAFYERCGFSLKMRHDGKGIALLAIGSEAPGLMIRTGEGPSAGRLWVEVRDADEAARVLAQAGLATKRLETATGITCEVEDPFGNVIGFADYTKRRELARSR